MNKSEKFWDNRANEYAEQEKNFEPKYNRSVKITRKYLSATDTVLDFACGSGMLTNQFSDYVKEIHAIDISSKMIEVAQRYAAVRNIQNIQYTHSNIFDNKLKKGSYSVIIAFNILHLLDEPQQVLKRINELLVPGGFFISETPCLGEKRSFTGKFLKFLSKLRLVPFVNTFKFSDLDLLLSREYFKIIEIEDLEQKRTNYLIIAKK